MYANNLSFCTVNVPTFRTWIPALRSGFRPLGSRQVAITWLDGIHDSEKSKLMTKPRGSRVTMSCDGWIAPMNIPTIGICVNDHLLQVFISKYTLLTLPFHTGVGV